MKLSSKQLMAFDVIIAVIALILAGVSWTDAKRLRHTLSTRYIGTFPGTLSHVSRVAKQAKKRLLIACDLPAYGIYSAHGGYISYRSAITGKVGKIRELSVVVMDSAWRKELARKQFQGIDFKTEIRPSDAFQGFLQWSHFQAADLKDMSAFQNALLAVQTDAVQDFVGSKVPIKEVGASMPLYVWIVDDEVAIFSIPSFQLPRSSENAFETRDPELIKQLTLTFRAYESRAVSARVPQTTPVSR